MHITLSINGAWNFISSLGGRVWVLWICWCDLEVFPLEESLLTLEHYRWTDAMSEHASWLRQGGWRDRFFQMVRSDVVP